MTVAMPNQAGVKTPETTIKPELLRLFGDLSPSKQVELLNFARFLHQQTAEAPAQGLETLAFREVPADSLLHLTGLVALGGDAVVDTEALYDGA